MGWLQEGMRRFGRTELFKILGPRTAAPVDRIVHRITGGRWRVSELFMPSLILHHRGRRSGTHHETPLFYLDHGSAYAVIGSNFGRDEHPAWALNLLEEPFVEVEVDGRRSQPVRARLVDGAERAAIWSRARRIWPAYDVYAQRVDGVRSIHVFVLEPVASG